MADTACAAIARIFPDVNSQTSSYHQLVRFSPLSSLLYQDQEGGVCDCLGALEQAHLALMDREWDTKGVHAGLP